MRLLVLAPALLLAGCLDPMRRADDLWPYVGDAVAANRVIQSADPWPRTARDTNIQTNGARVAETVVRYKSNQQGPASPPPALVTR